MSNNISSITNLKDIEDILVNKSEINKELLKEIQVNSDEIQVNSDEMSGGHFRMNSNPKEVFYNFLRNSNVTLLADIDSSVFGIVLKCTLKSPNIIPEVSMNYWKINTESILENNGLSKVTSLCIKIGFVSNIPHSRIYLKDRSRVYSKGVVSEKDYIDEANIQNVIVSSTNQFCEAAAPYIVYFNIFKFAENILNRRDINPPERNPQYRYFTNHEYPIDETQVNDIHELLKIIYDNGDDRCKQVIEMLRTAKYNNQRDERENIMLRRDSFIRALNANLDGKFDINSPAALSIIVMEIVNSDKTLQEQFALDNTYDYMLMYLHEIIRSSVEAGAIHQDAHSRNILYLPNYPYYSNEPTYNGAKTGRLQLIDFGQVKILTPEEKEDLQYEKNIDTERQNERDRILMLYLNDGNPRVDIDRDEINILHPYLPIYVNYFSILNNIIFHIGNTNTTNYVIMYLLHICERKADGTKLSIPQLQHRGGLANLKRYLSVFGRGPNPSGIAEKANRNKINTLLYSLFNSREKFINNDLIEKFSSRFPEQNSVERLNKIFRLIQKLNYQLVLDINETYAPVSSPPTGSLSILLRWLRTCTAHLNDIVVDNLPIFEEYVREGTRGGKRNKSKKCKMKCKMKYKMKYKMNQTKKKVRNKQKKN
jgi:hypothetical protein